MVASQSAWHSVAVPHLKKPETSAQRPRDLLKVELPVTHPRMLPETETKLEIYSPVISFVTICVQSHS